MALLGRRLVTAQKGHPTICPLESRSPHASSVYFDSGGRLCGLARLYGCSKPAKARTPKTGGVVALKTSTLAEVEQTIAAQKGKVVVVDCWGYFCPPCKAEFPKLVALSEDYADKGLVCMSVSFDDKRDRDGALEFLKSNEAAFNNFWLPEKEGILASEKWAIEFFPTVFVYDLAGKMIPFRDGVAYEDIEVLVKSLLAAPN